MRGNLRDLTEQINGEWSTNVVGLATVISKECIVTGKQIGRAHV